MNENEPKPQSPDDLISSISSGNELSLSEKELSELKQARNALSLLGHIREDIELLRNDPDDHSPLDKSQQNISTFGNLLTTPSVPAIGESFPGTFGRFQSLSLVGQGGFAHVFRAFDPVLDREVALKIPKPQVLVSQEATIRFQREAKAAAMLSHPAIVPVFESGAIGPIAFIASQYCPGETLATWLVLQDGASKIKTTAQILAKLAEAIHYAHQRGVVHRDLKPANILVGRGDEPIADRIRITDFGLAKQLETDDATLTVDGAVVGTPAYMSPEQAMGAMKITHSTDIWSLGVILYQMLTGKLPFSKQNHLQTLKSLENDRLVSPRTINPSVPADLNAICETCLAKSPSDRFKTAFDLESDLKRWLEGLPISVRPVSQFQHLIRWTKRNPTVAAALAFAFGCFVVGLSLTTWKWQAAIKQQVRAEKNAEFAQQVVKTVVSEVSDELADSPEYIDLRKKLANDAILLQVQLLNDDPDNPEVLRETAIAYRRLALIQHAAFEVDSAIDSFEKALQTLPPKEAWLDSEFPPDSIRNHEQLELDLHLAYASILSRLDDKRLALSELNDLYEDLKGGYDSIDEAHRSIALARYWLLQANLASSFNQLSNEKDAVTNGLEELGLIGNETADPRLQYQLLIRMAAIHGHEAEFVKQIGVVEEAKRICELMKQREPTSLAWARDAADADTRLASSNVINGNYETGIELANESCAAFKELMTRFPDNESYCIGYFSAKSCQQSGYRALKQLDAVEKELKATIKEYAILNANLQSSPEVVSRFVGTIFHGASYFSYFKKPHLDPIPMLDRIIEIQRPLVNRVEYTGIRRLLADCLTAHARSMKLTRKDFKGALKSLDESRGIIEEIAKTNRRLETLSSLAKCYEDIASTNYQLKRYDEAIRFCDLACSTLHEAHQEYHSSSTDFEWFDNQRKWCTYQSSLGACSGVEPRVQAMLESLPTELLWYVRAGEIYTRCSRVLLVKADATEVGLTDEEVEEIKAGFESKALNMLELGINLNPEPNSIDRASRDAISKSINLTIGAFPHVPKYRELAEEILALIAD